MPAADGADGPSTIVTDDGSSTSAEFLIIGAGDHRWAEVLAAARGYDSYHLAAYHQLAEERGEGQGRLLVYREGRAFVAFPLLIRPIATSQQGDGRLFDATSVYGYAGPIVSRAPVGPGMQQRLRIRLAAALTERRIVTVFSRLDPMLDQDGVLNGLGTCHTHGATISMDLEISDEDRRAAYRLNHRRDLRRLRAAGYRCYNDTNFAFMAEFVRVYHETMRRADADPYYFFETRYFTRLQAVMAGHLSLVVARQEEKIAAAALFFERNGIVQYHLGGACDRHSQAAPLKLVLDGAAAMFRRQGAKVLHLGGGRGGREDSLFAFKAGFSSRRHPFRTWQWIVRGADYDRLLGGRAPPADAHDFFPPYRRQEPRVASATTGRLGIATCIAAEMLTRLPV